MKTNHFFSFTLSILFFTILSSGYLQAQLSPGQMILNANLEEAFNECDPVDVFRQFPGSTATMPIPGMGLNGKITYGQGAQPSEFDYSNIQFREAIG